MDRRDFPNPRSGDLRRDHKFTPKLSPREVSAAAEWDARKLPAPTTRSAFAVNESIDEFGARWSDWATRLRITYTTKISVLVDGAEWIWIAASVVRAGPGLAAFRRLSYCDHIGQTLEQEASPSDWEALDELTIEFAVHTRRLNYCHRLHPGQLIGSGMVVECATKKLVVRHRSKRALAWSSRTSTKWQSCAASPIAYCGAATGRHPTNCQDLLAHPACTSAFVSAAGKLRVLGRRVKMQPRRLRRFRSRQPSSEGKAALTRRTASASSGSFQNSSVPFTRGSSP